MRIEGKPPIASPPGPRAAAAAADAFQLSAPAAPVRSAAAGGLAQASAPGAVLALQLETLDPERRRRQLARGEQTLDALEGARLAILGAGGSELAAQALGAALTAAREVTGEPGLDQVLAEIEQRAAVELAKLEMRRGR